MEKDRIVFKGSHPDSLYRVPASSVVGDGKMARGLQMLRWPIALITVCAALTVFVYYLIPGNMEMLNSDNGTVWAAGFVGSSGKSTPENTDNNIKDTSLIKPSTPGSKKTSEIDFFEVETDTDLSIKFEETTVALENDTKVKLAVPPVFPTHITPEVQYGNENIDKFRVPKVIEENNVGTDDSTSKPHITQSPEKPLAIYFKDADAISNNNTSNDTKSDQSITTQRISKLTTSAPIINPTKIYIKSHSPTVRSILNTKSDIATKNNAGGMKTPVARDDFLDIKPVVEENLDKQLTDEAVNTESYGRRRPIISDSSFTSGHSKLFAISFEESEKLKSTTQNSVYNTRVSPTLPTWKEEASSTEKYSFNVLSDVSQCGSTRLTLCRGILPYDLTSPSVSVGNVPIASLLSQFEYLVASNCSTRLAHFACALLEPECSPPQYPPKMPCYNLCRAIMDSCQEYIPRELSAVFNCNRYSGANCIPARSPCHLREYACGDNTCIPRDWICDGARDCPGGEDESKCVTCDPREFRCRSSGACVLKQWLCDGYTDCPDGEDESAEICSSRGQRHQGAGRELQRDIQLDEEPSGSAPAPSVRRPNRLSNFNRRVASHATDADSSKELLMTSDSNNGLRRNYTRRLTPYSRPRINIQNVPTPTPIKNFNEINKMSNPINENGKDMHNGEDLNGDLGFFDEFNKGLENSEEKQQLRADAGSKDVAGTNQKPASRPAQKTMGQGKVTGRAPEPPSYLPDTSTEKSTKIDKGSNKLERVIDGASMLKKAAVEQTGADKDDYEEYSELSDGATNAGSNATSPGRSTAHASPCPSGELRCVDGRCITLAQLCDGTIDCTDHADEDNCYT